MKTSWDVKWEKTVMNKPVYLCQAILDLSEIITYEFHYDYMKRKYDSNRLQLCYMDIDSLVYHIKTKDFYADISNDVEQRFDMSGYNKQNTKPLLIRKNKKVIGLMKDELGDVIMTEFKVLRPTLYSYRKVDGSKTSEDKKCKGIKKCIFKKTLTSEDYKTCLFNNSTEYRSQLMFRSTKHEVHTIKVNKVALNEMTINRLLRKTGFPHSLEVITVNYYLFSAIYKMPLSKFRERPVFGNNEGSLKCTCSQVLGYKSKREEKLNFNCIIRIAQILLKVLKP